MGNLNQTGLATAPGEQHQVEVIAAQQQM